MSDNSNVSQKASKWTPFVFIALTICIPAAQANDCSVTHFHETVKIAQIYDGDTVKLSDGRKVRFIGINTPERGRDGGKDEPFYLAAKQQLQQIIEKNNNQINIVFGKEKHDRYNRLLAHIFTTTGENITATLINKGLGFSIAIPPNIQFLTCYQKAEQQAQDLKQGLWSHPFSNVIESSSLSKSTRGFRRVAGTVKRIGESRSAFWLNLNTDQDTKFALRIQKKHLKHFKTYHPSSLINKRLIARGWINQQKNELRMSVQHPASLQLKGINSQ